MQELHVLKTDINVTFKPEAKIAVIEKSNINENKENFEPSEDIPQFPWKRVRFSQNVFDILDKVHKIKYATTGDIAEELGKKSREIHPYLYRLQKRGIIAKKFGFWWLTDQGIQYYDILKKIVSIRKRKILTITNNKKTLVNVSKCKLMLANVSISENKIENTSKIEEKSKEITNAILSKLEKTSLQKEKETFLKWILGYTLSTRAFIFRYYNKDKTLGSQLKLLAIELNQDPSKFSKALSELEEEGIAKFEDYPSNLLIVLGEKLIEEIRKFVEDYEPKEGVIEIKREEEKSTISLKDVAKKLTPILREQIAKANLSEYSKKLIDNLNENKLYRFTILFINGIKLYSSYKFMLPYSSSMKVEELNAILKALSSLNLLSYVERGDMRAFEVKLNDSLVKLLRENCSELEEILSKLSIPSLTSQ